MWTEDLSRSGRRLVLADQGIGLVAQVNRKGRAYRNGELLRAKHARVLRRGERNAWLEIVLDEGKNRQIRRIFEHLGIEVLRLVRVAIGPLQLGDLAKGKFRALTAREKAAIDRAMSSFVNAQRIASAGAYRQ